VSLPTEIGGKPVFYPAETELLEGPLDGERLPPGHWPDVLYAVLDVANGETGVGDVAHSPNPDFAGTYLVYRRAGCGRHRFAGYLSPGGA